MLNAKRVLAVIAIVLCAMEILALFVQVIRPAKEEPEFGLGRMFLVKRSEVIRRTLVWYIAGIVLLGTAASIRKKQPWLQLSFGIGGFSAMLIGCSGAALASREFLWPRFILSLLTLTILVGVSVRFSREAEQLGATPLSTA
jgi:hypothetical protein